MEEANKIFLEMGLKDKVEVMSYRKEDLEPVPMW